MKHWLNVCRERLGQAPRQMTTDQDSAFRLRVRAMFECFLRDQNDPLIQILADQQILRDRGEVYWGYFVQANENLFVDRNTHTCPADIVFSVDPFFDDRAHLLGELASGLSRMKGTTPADPSLADVVRVITNETERLLCAELPRSFCHGHSVFFATIFVEPRQLPGGYIAQPLIPVVANPAETSAVMILPSSYWPDEMATEWNPHAVKPAPKRPAVVPALPENNPVKGVPDWLPAPTPRPGLFSRLFGGRDNHPRAAAEWAHAIARSPDNYELPLAFADWLDASGEKMSADLIRTQMEFEEFEEGDSRGDDLYNRAAEVIQANAPRWFGPLKSIGLEPFVGTIYMPYLWFRRGLLDKVDINRPEILPKQADRLFDAAPALQRISVQSIRVTPSGEGIEWEPDLARMFWVPQMRQINELDLGSIAMSQENACAPGGIPYLASLRRLIMGSTEYGLEAALALGKSPYLTNLRDLGLSGWGMGEEGIYVLAASGILKNLSIFDLTSCYIGPGGAEALFGSTGLGALTSLRLGSNRLMDAGVIFLAQCPALDGLTHLNLNRANISVRGAEGLANSPILARLKHLGLESNRLDSEGLTILARSSHLTRMKHLDLGFNKIGNSGVESLTGSAICQNLTELRLRYNKLSDPAVIAIAESAGLKRLKILSLAGNKIGPDGAAALAQATSLDRLEEIDLGNNPIGPAGAKALARSRALRRLERLHVTAESVGEKGMALLYERFGLGVYEAAPDLPDDHVPAISLADILSGRIRK